MRIDRNAVNNAAQSLHAAKDVGAFTPSAADLRMLESLRAGTVSEKTLADAKAVVGQLVARIETAGKAAPNEPTLRKLLDDARHLQAALDVSSLPSAQAGLKSGVQDWVALIGNTAIAALGATAFLIAVLG